MNKRIEIVSYSRIQCRFLGNPPRILHIDPQAILNQRLGRIRRAQIACEAEEGLVGCRCEDGGSLVTLD
jgi:hypothetical protein